MTIDLERFLAPISGDDPAGPDLAYDPDRFRIEQAFDTPSGSDGSTDAPAISVDWREITALIVDQADRTKDIWLAIYLARAGARSGRLDVTVAGVQALAGLTDRFWDTVHPRLEDYGFPGRRGACDTLANFTAFVSPLQGIALIEHERFGRFDGADLIRFARGGANEDGYGAFRAALDDPAIGPESLVAAIAHLDVLAEALREVDATLVAFAEGDTGSNFAPVYVAIRAIRAAANALLPAELRDDADTETIVAVPGSSALPDVLNGRADVAKALDLVIDFYRRQEPSSPIPLLLERAKTWIPLDFIEILDDIAPRSIDEVKNILSARAQR